MSDKPTHISDKKQLAQIAKQLGPDASKEQIFAEAAAKGVGKPRKFTEEEETLRGLLNVPPEGEAPREGLPKVPRAAPYQPQPQVLGQDLAQILDMLQKIAPYAGSNVKNIAHGPTSTWMDTMIQNDPELLNAPIGTNLLGLWGPNAKDIYVNPYSMPQFRVPAHTIMAHELAHSAGRKHGEGPEEAEWQLEQLLNKRKAKVK